jgi:ABC-type transporter lipoprotein component MlaA
VNVDEPLGMVDSLPEGSLVASGSVLVRMKIYADFGLGGYILDWFGRCGRTLSCHSSVGICLYEVTLRNRP